MALKLIFNPISGKFDYIDVVDTSAFAAAVPRIITSTSTFTVATNVQVSHANQIVIEAGGQLLIQGTGVITYVN